MKYIICLFIMSCSSTNIVSKVVVDRFDKAHIYNKEPKKDKTVLYCQIHYEWETIRFYYTDTGIKYWIRKN